MAVYLCHEFPDLYEHEASVVDARPGRVLLDRSAFHPGGGGQVSDIGWLEFGGGTVPVIGIETRRRRRSGTSSATTSRSGGRVVVRVDAEHRSRVAQLHTDSHMLNALVYERFPGTLVTGAQINADGTGRMDFDLSEIDNDVLRALDAGVNDVIQPRRRRAQRLRRRRRRRRRRPDSSAACPSPRRRPRTARCGSSTSRASIARRAAGPTCRTPASPARSGSPRSRTRASATAASASSSSRTLQARRTAAGLPGVAGDQLADDPGRLGDRVPDGVGVGGRADDDHPDPHVQRAVELVGRRGRSPARGPARTGRPRP